MHPDGDTTIFDMLSGRGGRQSPSQPSAASGVSNVPSHIQPSVLQVDGNGRRSTSAIDVGSSELPIDFTAVPAKLDRAFDMLDSSAALRPTKLEVDRGASWTKLSHKSSLLREAEPIVIAPDRRDAGPTTTSEKNRVFDLLDSLSRSAELTIDAAELHVMLAVTHSFDKSVMDTVIEDSINPIDLAEHSSLIVAMTIHNMPVEQLVG